MMAVNPGLEQETLRHVLDLENRIITRLLLNGMRVNNGLFEATPQCKGLVHGTAWDPATNEIYVNLIQGKDLREAIRETAINVVGEKGATMYLSTSLDAATGLDQFNATAGANLTLTGKNIKVVGDDPSVGITLTDSGDYTLTITTQFGGNSNSLLKTPRALTQTVHVAAAEEEGGGSPGGV